MLRSLLIITWVALFTTRETAVAETISFEEDVLPILEARCEKCHGAKKQKGKLRLDSLDVLARGGESGIVVQPGNPEASALLRAVSWEDEDRRMPPKSRLPDAEIAVLRSWVESGAVELRATTKDPGSRGAGEGFSSEDRAYWFFQPLRRLSPPGGDRASAHDAIDAFMLAKLESAGLEMAPPAGRRTLIRRLTFDLLGLPPTPLQIDEFLADDSEDAYTKLVDRLLASPRYGERWARHWLDLVRYADSNGYRADEYRSTAWRYRDWVVGAFNDDTPYDRFVHEQIAGDEEFPDTDDGLIATGFLRLWPYESNQKDVRRQWSDIVDDVTGVTAEVFLGLSMGCARCHDHKFDPILQKDYFRLRAFLGTIFPERGLRAGSRARKREHAAKLSVWLASTSSIRDQIAAIEERHYQQPMDRSIVRFPEDFQPVLRAPYAELPPLERQLHNLGHWQVRKEAGSVEKSVKGKDAPRRKKLLAELAGFDHLKPPPLPEVMAVVDVGKVAPVTYIPGKESLGDVLPGYLSILDPEPAAITPPAGDAPTSGRRSTLSRWITRGDNQLTTRVIVNRVWQYHFGRGLVATSSDFGRQGQRPSHPDLLDWLATEFVARGWSFKDLHRALVRSRTYRQSALVPSTDRTRAADDDGALLWRMRVRRLAAEQLRDALLVASGELESSMRGPGQEASSVRRSIYLKVLRNKRAGMSRAFDGPDGFNSCARRNRTTTAPQALLLLNGDWTLSRARAAASTVERHAGADPRRRIERAYLVALGRRPEADEAEAAERFLEQQTALIAGPTRDDDKARHGALVDFCHMLFNSNEFVYVD